jgi:hypothetical protein
MPEPQTKVNDHASLDPEPGRATDRFRASENLTKKRLWPHSQDELGLNALRMDMPRMAEDRLYNFGNPNEAAYQHPTSVKFETPDGYEDSAKYPSRFDRPGDESSDE